MEKIYTPKEVAEILQISEFAIRDYLKEGKMKGFRVGRFWRIKESDFKAFIDQGGEEDG